MERLITHGPKDTLHRRLPETVFLPFRTLRSFRHQPRDRLQVDRAVRSGRPIRAAESIVAAALLDFRRHHPTWGAKKLLRILSKRHPKEEWPSVSTGSALLKRHGLVFGKKRRSYLRAVVETGDALFSRFAWQNVLHGRRLHEESANRLQLTVRLHRSASEPGSAENQLIDLWASLERLLAKPTGRRDRRRCPRASGSRSRSRHTSR